MTNSSGNTRDRDQQTLFALESEGKTRTYLYADEKVIARVTDGIYREPWAAFRELISNAYDADATEVFINTDYPHFKKIEIRDNGNGMTETAVVRLVHHIGGSSKRDKEEGKKTGTTDREDPFKSPGGRFLIGKLGIGLFAISQLTQHFQIVTKIKGELYQTVAVIFLNTYQEGNANENKSGDVEISREDCQENERDKQWTSIYLMDLRPETIDILRDKKRWDFAENSDDEDGQLGGVSSPDYHIGRFDEEGGIKNPPVLPWKVSDNQDVKFKNFFSAVTDSDSIKGTQGLDLDVFDYYLQMLWKLGLSSPLPYLESHPFNLKKGIDLYKISNQPKGQPESICLQAETIGEALNFSAGGNIENNFKVIVDGVSLKRPISYAENVTPSKRSPMEKPIMLVGRYNPYMTDNQKERAGGELDIEAAIYWNNVIVPKANNGILIQIHGANGTLFDKSFLDYRVSEQTRLRQITAEIFVQKGLDGALNIDRESFNHSHPHYILMRNWLHSAIRQLTNKHKEIGRNKNVSKKKEHSNAFVKKILDVWHAERGKDNDPPLSIQSDFLTQKYEFENNVAEDIGSQVNINISANNRDKENDIRLRVSAIVAVLDAYDLLSDMPSEKKIALVKNVYYAATGDDSVSIE